MKMDKEEAKKQDYLAFLNGVKEEDLDFVDQIDQALAEKGYGREIKAAKSGFVVSYKGGAAKHTLFNYVFRKTGMLMRLYGEHAKDYQDLLDSLPEDMKKRIRKAGPCKRLLDPSACSSRCSMGYVFQLEGEQQVKCRYNAFLLPVTEESKPYLQMMLEREVAFRG